MPFLTAWLGVIRLPSPSATIPASRRGWRFRAPEFRSAALLASFTPQRLIDDRRVFARMGLVLVNDLAAIDAVCSIRWSTRPFCGRDVCSADIVSAL